MRGTSRSEIPAGASRRVVRPRSPRAAARETAKGTRRLRVVEACEPPIAARATRPAAQAPSRGRGLRLEVSGRFSGAFEVAAGLREEDVVERGPVDLEVRDPQSLLV